MKSERQLMEDYLEDNLTPEDEGRLAAWLAADREHVREFVRETYMHRQLREAMLARQFRTDELAAVATAEPKPGPSVFRSLAQRLAQLFTFRWSPLPSRAWLVVGGSLAIAVGLGGWYFNPTRGEPVLADIQGEGLSLERAGESLSPSVGTRLQAGDALRVPESVTAAISFTPETTLIRLRPGTELRLATMASGKRLVLSAGTLEASVARQRPFQPMTLLTPQAEARVVGTKFTLTAETGSTRLEVTEGAVELTNLSDAVSVKVPAGHYTVAAANYELAALPLTGSIVREYWTNLPGNYYITFLTSHPNFPDRPSGREYLDKFEAPSGWGRNYGARIRGYLHPPRTGDYTFWIASGNGAELWLSEDDDPDNRQQIGYAETTARHEWTKHLGQQSSSYPLVAGRKYYIEALHKQGEVEDHLAVAWHGPGGQLEVIPGKFLSPAKPTSKEEKR